MTAAAQLRPQRSAKARPACWGIDPEIFFGAEPASRLPRLSWSLGTDGLLIGHAGAECAEDEVAGVLAQWAEVLGLTHAPVTPACAGSVVYSGTVDGRAVLIWGVTDRRTWEAGGAR